MADLLQDDNAEQDTGDWREGTEAPKQASAKRKRQQAAALQRGANRLRGSECAALKGRRYVANLAHAALKRLRYTAALHRAPRPLQPKPESKTLRGSLRPMLRRGSIADYCAPTKLNFASAVLLFAFGAALLFSFPAAAPSDAQSNAQSDAQNGQQSSTASQTAGSQTPVITVRSNLVLVPALVKTKAGEVVFSLTADDFKLTDNGVPQTLQLEADTDSQPLALAVIVQTGGLGSDHLRDYRDLGAVLDAVIGNVPHRVAVIAFDSKPHLALDFTAETDAAAKTIATLDEGDPGVAILDAINFGISILRDQPPEYRRAVVLCSETIDASSETSLEDAVRAVDDTNTAIYSFAFSSTKAAVSHEASKLPPLPGMGGGTYSSVPYGPGGCMSKDPNADPDAHGKRSVQALDCASDLLPPLRLARMAYLAAKDGLKRNVPESVAQLTGGEYFPFKDAKTLSHHLVAISNDVHNYYVLSFRPQSPDSGLHALELTLKYFPNAQISARKAYWVEAEAAPNK